MAIGKIGSISIDCAEPGPLARFWAQVTGGEIAFETDRLAAVRLPGGAWLTAVGAEDFRPPTWPDADVPQQIHLDISVDDLDAAEQAALDAGAGKPPHQPAPERYRVLLDPAGHPFCVTTGVPD